MRKIKSFVISIIIMLIISLLSLLVISVLVYMFKWQADKAMTGIIITYVLAGFAGGVAMSRMIRIVHGNDVEIRGRKKGIAALLLSSIFMAFLSVVSVLGVYNSFKFSSRFLLIWLLVASSAFVGMCMVVKHK